MAGVRTRIIKGKSCPKKKDDHLGPPINKRRYSLFCREKERKHIKGVLRVETTLGPSDEITKPIHKGFPVKLHSLNVIKDKSRLDIDVILSLK